MSFSYDLALPTDKDKVRFYIGDYTEATAIYPDQTIQALLDTGQDPYYVAADLALQQMARYAPAVDIQDDDIRKSRSQLFDHWQTLEASLRERSNASAMAVGDRSPTPQQIRERMRPDDFRHPRRGSALIDEFFDPDLR
ncbi:MAG: hypothetical protein ACREDR_17800 [Blastocatellia bacterium]